MPDDTLELDQMQNAYRAAVEEWITAIKEEEALASVNHSVSEIIAVRLSEQPSEN